MEAVWGAVKLMFFIYGLAAVLSLIVAWILKLLFAAVQAQKARAAAAEGTEDDKTASEGSA
ncbi:MAG: hypothetical protein HOO19_07725 [Rhodospirillaceae bacterium]|jgi:hypothetical protein|nr:hypothetical protein [Rhodospirillaceae bacterium]MBT3886059.1 hypothetical protein [Rhodospirillaceae bacterium]MBT4117018.1 hypothetical protein [Rhodospirillaceae bacterium]MBT4672243.1 hypothetical protein [Rhodospirillaceae bacterium]MBT4718473.1 hypothetical protein [Rhodospirillaceae bacterium]